ncbi:BID domain-containing protein [Pseudoroseomonas wenyumeiae]
MERARASGAAAAAYLDRAASQTEPPPPPLLPAQRDPTGRDSLGRGTTAEEIAAAEARDPAVRQEASDRVQRLRAAYRDPVQAEAQLDALLWDSRDDRRQVAHQLREKPELLGRLRGRDGLFSGRGRSWSGPVRSARCAPSPAGWSERRRHGSGLGRPIGPRWRRSGRGTRWRCRGCHSGPGGWWRRWSRCGPPACRRKPARRRKPIGRRWRGGRIPPWPKPGSGWCGAARGGGGTAGGGRDGGAAAAATGVEQSLTAKAAEAATSSREGLAGVGRAVAALREGQRAVEAQERVQAQPQEAEQQRLGIRRAPGLGR